MNKLFPIFLTLILLFSCSSAVKKGKTEAETLFNESRELVKDKKFIMAIERLNELKTQYPYSFYATPAELLLADIYFQQENFEESAQAYLLYREMHPKDVKMAYVIWMIAESYFNLLPPTFDRDLSPSAKARLYYNQLALKYPSSKYTGMAKKKLGLLKNLLDKKEFYIINYYLKVNNFDAAMHKCKLLLEQKENVKNTPLGDHCRKTLVKATFHLKQYSKCLEYSQKFIHEIQLENDKAEIRRYSEKCQQPQP